jgi:hypothetical protein
MRDHGQYDCAQKLRSVERPSVRNGANTSFRPKNRSWIKNTRALGDQISCRGRLNIACSLKYVTNAAASKAGTDLFSIVPIGVNDAPSDLRPSPADSSGYHLQ